GAERSGAAHSPVKTSVDRLEKKGAIERVANRGRVILYAPAVKQERIRKPLVRAFLRRVLGDDLKPLFAQLLQDESLSDEELAYLRDLIAESRAGKAKSRGGGK